MRLADLRVNAPRGLLVAIKRVFDGPAGLIEIRGRTNQLNFAGCGGNRFEDQ